MKTFLTREVLLSGSESDYSVVGKVSAESVRKHTGRDWAEWIKVLVKAGADDWTHAEIVAFLKKKHRLSPWWQQGVALGFEIATGRRKVGQDLKGKYMVTATKSLPRPAREVWNLLSSAEGQRIWLKPLSEFVLRAHAQFETLDGFFGEVRTVQAGRRLRLFWQDPQWEKHTVVELLIVARPKKKSILVFNHTGIADLKTQALCRTRWKEAAAMILKALESES
jgi:uncharacterized protein YndB with AHSA1/START domain